MACKCGCGIKVDITWLMKLLVWGCIVFYFANKYAVKKESDAQNQSKTQIEKKI